MFEYRNHKETCSSQDPLRRTMNSITWLIESAGNQLSSHFLSCLTWNPTKWADPIIRYNTGSCLARLLFKQTSWNIMLRNLKVLCLVIPQRQNWISQTGVRKNRLSKLNLTLLVKEAFYETGVGGVPPAVLLRWTCTFYKPPCSTLYSDGSITRTFMYNQKLKSNITDGFNEHNATL